MARYGFPHDLFPSGALVEHRYQKGSWTPFEKQFRDAAFLGYARLDTQDKELSRFMVPHLEWVEKERAASSYKHLGEYSWIATVDKAPFIPATCFELMKDSLQGPRSLMHLIGATFNRMRILYSAENLEIELDDFKDREVMFVICEKDISVTVVDTIEASSLQGRIIIGNLAPHSSVSWLSQHKGQLVQHDRWHLEKKASLEMTQVLCSSEESWLRKEYILDDEAQLSYTFLGALKAHEQSALSTMQEHRGSSSSSSVLSKTVGTDDSKSFYRGTIVIHPEAPQSVARQQQRALLLSGGARTCAIPSLEVLTHDVQCSHGSAVGQFDEEALHYLQSKGVAADYAKQLIIEGFFTDALSSKYSDVGKQLMKVLF